MCSFDIYLAMDLSTICKFIHTKPGILYRQAYLFIPLFHHCSLRFPRLCVSPVQNVIAIPHDNRHIRLYDINGNRIGRLPRTNRVVSSI